MAENSDLKVTPRLLEEVRLPAFDACLGDRIADLSPEMRRALGLPAIHIEDGRGNVAGHRPGFAYSPQQLTDRARQRADDPRRRAFEDYQKRLTDAWKNP